jgi:hypothetical protein
LHRSDHSLKLRALCCCLPQKVLRSVDDRDVLFVYREATVASYCGVTLVMASGEEISGRALTAAIDALQAKLNDMTPLPMAA